MKIIKQSYEVIQISRDFSQTIERAGRTCYKSEDRITPNSADAFVRSLIKNGHDAMLEFGQIMVRFVTNRGVTHELVRHRLFSFAQESTRYVNYNDRDMEFILPVWLYDKIGSIEYKIWADVCRQADDKYKELIDMGWAPQKAREVLPNSLKTEIVVAGNPREWRHCLKLRTANNAHPQMRALMLPLLDTLKFISPPMFEDI